MKYLEEAKNELIEFKDEGMPKLDTYVKNAAKWYHEVPVQYMEEIKDECSSMIDLGCGYGTLSIVGAKLGWDVSAVDYYYPYIPWRIRDKYNIDMHICNIEKEHLPFDMNASDLVVMVEVIEHLSTPEFTLADIHRVLKKGGYLIISTPNSEVWDVEDCKEEIGHVRHYSQHDLDKLISRNGFKVLNSRLYRSEKHIVIKAAKR